MRIVLWCNDNENHIGFKIADHWMYCMFCFWWLVCRQHDASQWESSFSAQLLHVHLMAPVFGIFTGAVGVSRVASTTRLKYTSEVMITDNYSQFLQCTPLECTPEVMITKVSSSFMQCTPHNAWSRMLSFILQPSWIFHMDLGSLIQTCICKSLTSASTTWNICS